MLCVPISFSFLKKEITLCLLLSLLFGSAVNRITGTGHAKEILLILNNIYIHPSNAYHFGFQQASIMNMQIMWIIIFSSVNKFTLKILKDDDYGTSNFLK